MLTNAPTRYEWDDNLKNIEKAKGLFIAAKNQHRTIEDDSGNVVTHWRQIANKFFLRIREVELNDTSVKMQIICEDGDKWVNWDSNSKSEFIEAAKKFNDYLGKGWLAYAVDQKTGKKGRRILEFDGEAEEVVFSEGPFLRLNKKDFAKKYKKVKVAAKTYPG